MYHTIEGNHSMLLNSALSSVMHRCSAHWSKSWEIDTWIIWKHFICSSESPKKLRKRRILQRNTFIIQINFLLLCAMKLFDFIPHVIVQKQCIAVPLSSMYVISKVVVTKYINKNWKWAAEQGRSKIKDTAYILLHLHHGYLLSGQSVIAIVFIDVEMKWSSKIPSH